MEQPNTIEENISRLMDSIKESAKYQEFQKQNAILKQNPELKSRVDAFRAENYRVQNECDADKLFDVVEQMGRESAELRRPSGSKRISGCRACSLQNDAENLREADRRRGNGCSGGIIVSSRKEENYG